MIHQFHRRKGAPVVGAPGPGSVGPFGPWGADEEDGAPVPAAEPVQAAVDVTVAWQFERPRVRRPLGPVGRA